MEMKIVLSIAGSDPSAGAGIQQDLKTMTALGCYGATVITALTSQNTLGVQDVMAVPPQTVCSQLRSVLDDLEVSAIKIGQIPNRQVAVVICEELCSYLSHRHVPVVYDPVMISTSGRRLMEEDCMSVLLANLFPLCTLVTPNIPETETLTGMSLRSSSDFDAVGRQLVEHYSASFLLKGGHSASSSMVDRLYCSDGTSHSFATEKVDSKNLHGTGCTLSSAIASMLAQGHDLQSSVRLAKDYVTKAIIGGKNLHVGNGNGPLWMPLSPSFFDGSHSSE